MSVESDVATYLASTGLNLGLTIASTGNLFSVPIPDGAPPASVCVVPYGGLPATRAFGSSLSAPVCEVRRFQVTARSSDATDPDGVETMIEAIYEALDFLGEATLSGTRYLNVKAVAPPIYVGQGENDQHVWTCNFEAWKER